VSVTIGLAALALLALVHMTALASTALPRNLALAALSVAWGGFCLWALVPSISFLGDTP
jgi:hypothetical protein